jgi:anti-sigma regulatory factor (Ser/Thr protein kinase)
MAASDGPLESALTPPSDPALDQLFDESGLYTLRSAVAAHGSELGLAEPVLNDLVLIAHELATNAVRHGGATPAVPGRLRLWTAGGVVVCQVRDAGAATTDLSQAGFDEVDTAANSGRGLWIIRQLARRLDVTTGPDGTIFTVVLDAG